MKTTIYKKDSWHYRINTSENMLIPLFTQKYGYDENNNYCKLPPTDSCTYWQNILLYFLVQIPIMLITGLFILNCLIFMPIYTIVMYFTIGKFIYSMTIGLIVICGYILCLLTALYAIILNNIDINRFALINDLKEMKTTLKDKFCKRLDFK